MPFDDRSRTTPVLPPMTGAEAAADVPFDCAIVGGGPAGLTAALYLARYRRRVLLADDGESRAALIPQSHNFPGFELSGPEILKRLRSQVGDYPSVSAAARVTGLRGQKDTFVLECSQTRFSARRVFLATGISDLAPAIEGLQELIGRGHLRFCPICDAYEAIDRKIGLLASGSDGWKKALFLRTYSRDVTLVLTGEAIAIPANARCSLSDAAVTVAPAPATEVTASDSGAIVRLADGGALAFDVLYPALGCEVHSSLATALGARHDDTGCLIVDSHQETSCPGLYAGGDVVSDLHQISVAIGHAAIAATAIHNSLPPDFR